MKVIATEFWNKLFQKSISNLQTNNKGKFKLQDDGCRILGKLIETELVDNIGDGNTIQILILLPL